MPAKAPQKSAGRALGYKEQRELASLPETIAALETEQTAVAARLADPDVYRTDRDAVTRLQKRAGEIEVELATAMARWEALERVATAP